MSLMRENFHVVERGRIDSRMEVEWILDESEMTMLSLAVPPEPLQ